MDQKLLHRYLSFGYSASEHDEEDVGRRKCTHVASLSSQKRRDPCFSYFYLTCCLADGVGGKAGMMKLGADALVLTRRGGAHVVGMLSVSMHEMEGLDEIVIPIVSFFSTLHSSIL